jgi:Flp pilus assembly protein TadG
MRRPNFNRFAREDGQSFVEFTLVLPIALVLILGVVDLGKATSYWLDSSHLANLGARYAVVDGCPGCSPAKATSIPDNIKNQAETDQLKNATTVCVEDLDGGSWSRGDRIHVTVVSSYEFLSFLKLPSITITGESTMRNEQDWADSPLPDSSKFCSA